jgi:metallo-beta-lactamase class B
MHISVILWYAVTYFVWILNDPDKEKGTAMKLSNLSGAASCAAIFFSVAASFGQPNDGAKPLPAPRDPAAMQQHTERARRIAGEDLKDTIGLLCTPEAATARAKTLQNPPPTRVFDNLYYVGLGYVGAWALRTSNGIILFDTLDNAAEAQQYIVGGLKTLGLEPESIKFIVIMHGHGDHYGGAKYMQDAFPKAHLLMSAADYAQAEKRASSGTGPFANVPAPRRDMVVIDGEKLTLGDTTIPIYITPGHTPGTISTIIPVKDHGKPHVISFWGGTTPPRDHATLVQYEQSFRRFTKLVNDAHAEGLISNHPVWDDAIAKMDKLRANPTAPNPFLMGKKLMDRYAEVQEECVQAGLAR